MTNTATLNSSNKNTNNCGKIKCILRKEREKERERTQNFITQGERERERERFL